MFPLLVYLKKHPDTEAEIEEIHLGFRSLSSGDCMGHTQGIILDKQQNVALKSSLSGMFQSDTTGCLAYHTNET